MFIFDFSSEKGVNKMSVEVTIRKGETIEKALRRLKKKVDRESILRDVRDKRYFEKPCEKRRRLKKIAAFNSMLRRKYDNM